MIIIGITGPTGAGKTTALGEVEKLGGAVIDCDAVYHELLESDKTLQNRLEQEFGDIRDDSGAVDRKKLGAIVFGDPEKLERLNAIAQRATVDRTRLLLEECRAKGMPLAAVDAIGLLESGMGELCHATVAVVAPPEVRVARIMAREGISQDYAWSRVRAQKPDSYYREHCTDVLENQEETPEAFREKAEIFFRDLLRQLHHITEGGHEQ